MIPKTLNEIEWADIEALRNSGREEDDTIEYKTSFSGGSDYLAFSDPKRAKAIEGIAREAVAFLNGRGGDIVIGVREAANDHPKIEEITPVSNIDQTVGRLAQSLAALIEPTQSVLALKAVRETDGDTDGVIVVRCPSSLRAPHRYTPTKECYIRRGRSSVPMPMDEVQDLTLRRADMMTERLKVLESQFSDLSGTLIGRQTLDAHRFHVRTCFVPATVQQIELTEDVLNAFRGGDPLVTLGEKAERFDVPFRNLGYSYRPILRGMSLEGFVSGNWSERDFFYCSKVIRSDGVLRTDFACRAAHSSQDPASEDFGFHSAWAAGYLANTLSSFAAVQRICPSLGNGILRIVIHSDGPITMATGSGLWASRTHWPYGKVVIPDFDIEGPDTLMGAFHQLQVDVASISGLTEPAIYKFAPNE